MTKKYLSILIIISLLNSFQIPIKNFKENNNPNQQNFIITNFTPNNKSNFDFIIKKNFEENLNTRENPNFQFTNLNSIKKSNFLIGKNFPKIQTKRIPEQNKKIDFKTILKFQNDLNSPKIFPQKNLKINNSNTFSNLNKQKIKTTKIKFQKKKTNKKINLKIRLNNNLEKNPKNPTKKAPKTTYLSQKDFNSGTYIIKTPGTYILTENITFNPPKSVPYSLLRQNLAFHLGFFASIIIQSSNITLDLNNHLISQSKIHYLNQRFYSHICLGSAPFKPKKGPHNFGNQFLPASKVTIKNGFLGLSSHHGIQGNDCREINLLNLKIYDFEVGGISINGGIDVRVENSVVGPSFKMVPVNGKFSSAVQIKFYLESLVHGGMLCGGVHIRIRGEVKTAEDVLNELISSLEKTEESFLNEDFEGIPEIYKNLGNFPDGSSLYGIVFHTKNPAVDGFNDDESKNHLCSRIVIKNTVIKGLTHKTKEMISLKKDGEILKSNFKEAQKDPRGSVFDIIDCTDEKGGYKPNPLGNAQLLVSKYKKCLTSKKSEFRKKHLYHTDVSRDTISPQILNWASFFYSYKLDNKNNFICNADQMLHSLKGTIGLRLSGVSHIKLENLSIKNIKNQAPFGSQICGQYKDNISFSNTVNGYLGADIRGISIESSKDILFENVKVENLKSYNGKVIGVDVMFKSKDVRGDVFFGGLEVREVFEIPDYFWKVPQRIPRKVGLEISVLSQQNLKVLDQIEDL